MTVEYVPSRLRLCPLAPSPLRRPRPLPSNLRMRKRRRLKLLAHFGIPPPVLSLPFDNLLHGLVSAFPSVDSLELILPALGFASGAAIYFSARDRGLRRARGPDDAAGDVAAVGEWILFTSPTPFNRCVLLRCPSVSFEDGGELLEGVNDRLVREERHYVNLSRWRIPVGQQGAAGADGVSYQRLCVRTEDGGVISLDWPENLELGREQGMDTTVVLVPGSTKGSMDGNVRALVHEALTHGLFPIVVNPRGCAGSPITTPRLFSAADSDDIATAIQFINKSRPWTTLMSIGWGYGANMLTKYLTEVGERTPLTATVCIDNPFDLNEATKAPSYHKSIDEKLTGGLVDILRANKELFQGKNRGFDVIKALSAKTVRDFDGAISMIFYGFRNIEDFYTKCSTRQLIHRVKIPLLFIQSDDRNVPLFSIPRTSITENPFTSLLLCSCLPSNIQRNERCAIIWCQNLAIEWLSAVEFALLKGRHPLLNDVEITITPKKSITMLEGKLSEEGTTVGDKEHHVYNSYLQNRNRGDLLKLPNSNAASSFLMDPSNTLLQNDGSVDQRKANDDITLGVDLSIEGSKGTASVDAGSSKEGGDNPVGSERSEVLGAATIILNMLDVTLPGTLDDERKKKVLAATEQGETFMKALQGAVPEDVRGKLTAAVSEIVQAQGTKINIDKLKKIGWFSSVPSSKKLKIEEQPRDVSTEGGPNGTPFADNGKSSAGNQERVQGDSLSHHISDCNAQENIEHSHERVPEASGDTESNREVDDKQSLSSEFDMANGALDTGDKVNQSHEVDARCDDGHINLEANEPQTKNVDAISEDKTTNFSSNREESPASGSSPVEHQQSQKEGNNVQGVNHENAQNSTKFVEPTSNCSSGNPPISVAQALDALTGFDDSTQMAVNSVFGVIENMIDQLEKEIDKSGGEERKDSNLESDDVSEGCIISSDHKSNNVNVKDESGFDLDEQSSLPQTRFPEEFVDTGEVSRGRWDERELIHDFSSSDSSAFGSFQGNDVNFNNLYKVWSVQNVPLDFKMNTYWEETCRAYLHKYFSSWMSDTTPLDSQSSTDLYLDPKEGTWKMLDHMESTSLGHNNEEPNGINKDQILQSMLGESNGEAIIEPSYAILDAKESNFGYESIHKSLDNSGKQADHDISGSEDLVFLVKDIVLEALKVEVARRLGMPDIKEIDSNVLHDLEKISDAVTQAVMHYSELSSGHKESSSVKFGTIQGQQIISTISDVVHGTNLGKVLPIGVIVGSTLASLRKYFHVTVLDDEHKVDTATDGPIGIQEKSNDKEYEVRHGHHILGKKEQNIMLNSSDKRESSATGAFGPGNKGAIVGAVTASLGASALLAHHQRNKAHESSDATEMTSNPVKIEESALNLHDKLEEVVQEKTHNNFVSTLVEKAMSVAGPVVPTKNDGEVDHERLVATLAELGQKGGMLRLIGKGALLWGGMRGAMSLTDRLISFLRIAERPLFQRIFGFLFMVLVLWSPVVIPLLPTLIESWTLKRSTGIAEYACIVGLYVAIMILIVLWGRRIRGHDYPLKQYGLDLASASKFHDFLKGFIGGTMLIFYVHSINALLGYAYIGRPDLPSSSVHVALLIKTYGWMLIQTLKGVVTATCIAIVEELLFRSWLPDEISVDLGYYQSIIISGILFSLLQRSLASVPGFLFLSLALFGAKERGNGSLLLPIGMRTGIMTANYIVQNGGFLYYLPNTPFWLASTFPWRPFNGIVGLGLCILMAVFLHPHQPVRRKEESSKVS